MARLATFRSRAGLGTALCIVISLLAGATAVEGASPAAQPAPKVTAWPDAVPPGVAADPLFTKPYIDIDEWRDAPVRHRYVHGGFTGTDMRFSFYFPPKENYEGRFFEYVTPVPDSENLAQKDTRDGGGNIGFAVKHGGYYIETNGGGASANSGPAYATDPTIGAYRANAAAAQFSRVVAARMYGGKRPFGYIWGGSGGAYRTVGSIENTAGVWDGAVPFVMGSSMATPYNFTAPLYAYRVLGDKLPGIIDAFDVGGTGDPYKGLDAEQSSALREILNFGYPLPELRALARGYVGAFPVLYPGMLAADPTYFTDFWTKPGYEGFDPPKSLRDARIQQKAKVVRLIMAADANRLGITLKPQMGQARGTAELAWQALLGPGGSELPVAIELDVVPQRDFGSAADLKVNSGGAAGALLRLQRLDGKIVILQSNDPASLAKLAAGDEVQIDNSNWLAAQTYHRHQVPTPDFYTWNQYRGPDGKPLGPQRAKLLGPQFAIGAAGAVPTGRIGGKVILVENLSDTAAWPWGADWYRKKVREHLAAKADGAFRVWFTEHAEHGGQGSAELVTFTGVLQQALLDVSAWVEKGIAPAPSTAYSITDGQVLLPPTAAARLGIQPVVGLQADGATRAEVAAGKPVTLTAEARVPDGTGRIVGGEWDFEGKGRFADPAVLEFRKDGSAVVSVTHAFAAPGTYFVGLRVTAQREAEVGSPYGRIMNLGRVRVVVK
ncbi:MULTISPECIES: PKD domain-containing protein [unclassified Novosphingobium]|uniref:PKD domain-containing protein n=1 Tax=unclassified Novosphingobium TaxID=2644732 RepID=UPI0013568DD4|nr:MULTISPECIES: PKD domain-containing protein [unclassified Novosphingobium]